LRRFAISHVLPLFYKFSSVVFSALSAPVCIYFPVLRCAKNVQKCAAPFDAGKNWNSAVSASIEFYAPFTAYSFIFFMIQNFSINIGSQARFGTRKTAFLHV